MKRLILVLGIVFLVVGFLACLFLGLVITNARIEGVFAAIASDSPTRRFKRLKCPTLLSENETGSVMAMISNPTGQSLSYLVTIEGYGFVILSPDDLLHVTVPGGQTVEIVWVVRPIEVGNATIAVQALSNQDRALPGPFHSWPTSYRQSCGVPVVDWLLTGKQLLSLGLMSLVIGVVLSLLGLYAVRRKPIDRPGGE